MTTLHLRKSISQQSFRCGLVLMAITLTYLALSPAPNAFGVSPAPDGGYPSGNTAEGTNALFSRTTGVWNTALGYQALYHVTTGNQNTATGYQTLFNTTTGSLSVANGSQALFNNTTGSFNTATGFRALYYNTTGSDNTGNGYEALAFNTTGQDNTANGFNALYYNTIGNLNTANGSGALFGNTIGNANTAYGYQALFNNTTGGQNSANGFLALYSNTTGTSNTANGVEALYNNTTGGNNIALGLSAGENLTTGSYNIDIGSLGVVGESSTIRIGEFFQDRAFIAGISGTAVTGSAVYIDTNTGQLGVLSSSERFKDGIKPMGNASEALLSLRPVTFRYKKSIDPKGAPQFGLVAEDVEKVNPDLVVRDAEGKVFTVRYEAVNAMLLNEFLKQHRAFLKEQRKVEEQEVTITQLKKEFQSKLAEQQKDFQATAAYQQKQIEAVTAGLQRVSAQVEMSRPAPQMVLNNQ
jgi:Chaperone of endosialidase